MEILSPARSAPSSSWPSQGAPLGALLDKVTIGLNVLLPVKGGPGWLAVRDRLVAMGLFPALPHAQPSASERVKVRFLVEDIGAEAVGQLMVSVPSSGAVTFGSGSYLILNPLRALRHLQPSTPQGPCLDGGDNTVGPCNDDFALFLEQQFGIVAETLDAFFASLRRACGEQALGGRIWVRAAEVCRDITLSEMAVELLANLPHVDGNPYVFPSGRNEDQHREGVRSAWNRIRKRAGLVTGVRLHDLRHSFASACLNNGASIYTVSGLLGHTDIRMTRRYAHLEGNVLRDAASAPARLIRPVIEAEAVAQAIE